MGLRYWIVFEKKANHQISFYFDQSYLYILNLCIHERFYEVLFLTHSTLLLEFFHWCSWMQERISMPYVTVLCLCNKFHNVLILIYINFCMFTFFSPNLKFFKMNTLLLCDTSTTLCRWSENHLKLNNHLYHSVNSWFKHGSIYVDIIYFKKLF